MTKNLTQKSVTTKIWGSKRVIHEFPLKRWSTSWTTPRL